MNKKVIVFLSNFLLATLFIYFVYTVIYATKIINKRHISTDDGVYVNNVSDAPFMRDLALKLTQKCDNDECKVQNILDYVTNIPYQTNHFEAHKPKDTLKNNYGDCDDKSNLLISLLHALDFESYFVLVPKHIFVIVYLKKDLGKKGFYMGDKKYYILESTAENSTIGFEFEHKLSDIISIIEPFSNKRLELKGIEYAN